MSAAAKPRVNCYSEWERRFMRQSQDVRDRLFRPLLVALVRWRIMPWHITLLSVLAGLGFGFALAGGRPLTALGLLAAHVVLDGLDGPLARYRNVTSNAGACADALADQAIVMTSLAAMMQAGYADAWPGGLYLLFYTLVVVFALVRSALAIPYAWLIRPRFLVYTWYAVEIWIWPGTLNLVLWIAMLPLAVMALTGAVRIGRQVRSAVPVAWLAVPGARPSRVARPGPAP